MIKQQRGRHAPISEMANVQNLGIISDEGNWYTSSLFVGIRHDRLHFPQRKVICLWGIVDVKKGAQRAASDYF